MTASTTCAGTEALRSTFRRKSGPSRGLASTKQTQAGRPNPIKPKPKVPTKAPISATLARSPMTFATKRAS